MTKSNLKIDCKISGEVWAVKETGVTNIGTIQVIKGIVVGEIEKQDFYIPLINFIYSNNILNYDIFRRQENEI